EAQISRIDLIGVYCASGACSDVPVGAKENCYAGLEPAGGGVAAISRTDCLRSRLQPGRGHLNTARSPWNSAMYIGSCSAESQGTTRNRAPRPCLVSLKYPSFGL